MMDTASKLIEMLEQLAADQGVALTITASTPHQYRYRIIQVGEFRYDVSFLSWEEGLFRAYVQASVHFEGKRAPGTPAPASGTPV